MEALSVEQTRESVRYADYSRPGATLAEAETSAPITLHARPDERGAH
jgi:hypothetical protein